MPSGNFSQRDEAVILRSTYSVEGAFLRVEIEPFARVFIPLSGLEAFGATAVHQTISAVLTFAWASDLAASAVVIETDYPVPPPFDRLVRHYGHLVGRDINFVSPPPDGATACQGIEDQSRPVLLFSGGKDSLAQLLRLRDQNIEPNLLYIRGPLINSEFTKETKNITEQAARFSTSAMFLDVHCEIAQSLPANVKSRCVWRELLLFCMARTVSDEIYTGVTEDALFSRRQLEVVRQAPSVDSKYVARFFAITDLAIETMARILGARIHKAEREIENLREVRKSMAPYSRRYSCYEQEVCGNSFAGQCAKCRAITAYGKILDNFSLSREEVEHILGQEWVGDDDLPMYIAGEMENLVPPLRIDYSQFSRWYDTQGESNETESTSGNLLSSRGGKKAKLGTEEQRERERCKQP